MPSRRRIARRLPALLVAASAWIAAGAGWGQEHGGHPPAHRDAGGTRTAAPSRIPLTEIPEASLTDQDGNRVRLYEDLIAGQVVAMNFIFTTCTTICPLMGATFAQLQKEMATRPGGQEIQYISVSIDPNTDTPERLKAWSKPFQGTERWTLLTGRQRVVDDLLKSLGVFTALKEDHAALILMGNDATRTWIRGYGLSSPIELAETLDELLAAERGEAGR